MNNEDIQFIQSNWPKIANRDIEALTRLEEIYLSITGETVNLKGCMSCVYNAYNTIAKHIYLNEMANKKPKVQSEPSTEKKYVLKPGNHRLVPGGSIYNNGNITDALAEAYIVKNPNLKQLFEKLPE